MYNLFRLNLQCPVPKIAQKLPVLDKAEKNGLFVNTNVVIFNNFMSGGIYKVNININLYETVKFMTIHS